MNGSVRWLVCGVIAGCALGLPGSAGADPTGLVGGAPVGVFAEGSAAHGDADPVTGAFTYTFRFELPAARGRVQPSLALSYNSSSKDREAGYGWGLDVPAIERKAMSGPVRFDDASASDYRFFYGGRPLVFVCDVAQGGCPANEAQPSWASTWTKYFRLQVDDLYARFYLSSDKHSWRVQLPGGELMELGDIDGGGQGTEWSQGGIVRWRLVKRSDPVHPANYVVYRWRPLGLRGLLYLTDIYDTPPATGGTPSDTDFAHHTQLSWDVAWSSSVYGFVGGPTGYASPERATPDMVLKRVGVASKTWTAAGAREVVRVYGLSYFPRWGSGAGLWGHAFLQRIQMQGDCHQVEDGTGQIPSSIECAAAPATTFEYDSGQLGFATSYTTLVGAPDAVATGRRYFTDVDGVALVDFDRDGLPDVVQSWDTGPHCGGAVTTVAPFDVTLPQSPDSAALYCTPANGTPWPIRNARAMVGYANGGIDPVGGQHFQHHCMDAGFDVGSSGFNFSSPATVVMRGSPPWPGRAASFLTPQGAASLGGSWSYGLVAWGEDGYAPFFAEPQGPGLPQPSRCDLENLDMTTFNPGWRWRRTEVGVDWAKPANAGNAEPGWFADIDGDGLIDRFNRTTRVQTTRFQSAIIEYTRRYGKGEKSNTNGQASSPTQVPFDTFLEGDTSLAPAPGNTTAKYFYVDINGDGLVDLVTSDPSQNNYQSTPVVRPGDGRGHFACDPTKQPLWGCDVPAGADEPTPAYALYAPPSPVDPWSFDQNTGFHDVTGDGLADLVKYDPATGYVRVWVNVNGRHFSCFGSGGDPCIVGIIFDQEGGTTNIGNHRMTFADMDGDGVDDVVLVARVGVFVGRVLATAPFADVRGARPGELIRVHNGYGATTTLQYRSVQDLDKQAARSGEPWAHHSAVVQSVVTRIVTQDTPAASGAPLGAPYHFERSVDYSYRDPAYDRWSRSLVGFRKVRAQYGSESAITETTRWFGPCDNTQFFSNAAGDDPTTRCQGTSDDDDDKGRTGKVIRIDRFIPGVAGQQEIRRLWTRQFAFYLPATLGPTSTARLLPNSGTVIDARRVFVSTTDDVHTYLYDDAQAVSASSPGSPAVAGGDPITPPDQQPGIQKVTHRKVERDLTSGSVFRTVDEGVVDGPALPDGNPETIVTTTFTTAEPADASAASTVPPTCTADWQCRASYVIRWPGQTPPALAQKTRYTFDSATGDVRVIEGYLEGALDSGDAVGLDRSNAAQVDTAWSAPGQITTAGWYSLVSLDYDAFGNVVQARRGTDVPGGSPSPCSSTTYDASYAQFPQVQRRFLAGCGSASLDTYNTFDRGFGVLVATEEASVALTQVVLDPFGRPAQLYLPEPDSAQPDFTTLAATINYVDASPVSRVQTTRVVDAGVTLESHTLLNGLGESVLTFDQGDGPWLVRGWHMTDGAGRVNKAAGPFGYAGDPATIAASAAPVPTTGALTYDITFDEFGRRTWTDETDAVGAMKTIDRLAYGPLAVIHRDAEQLNPSGPHSGAYTRVDFNGHGQPRITTKHVVSPTTNDIVTATTYDAGGHPQHIMRWSNTSWDYWRGVHFDSLGRLGGNWEPNSSPANGGHEWRYVYDTAGRMVGWSDTRGCGANLYYDGLGRVTAEDHAPCTASQPAYSAPDPVSGTGFEVTYRYDDYETGQMSSDSSFLENGHFAIGRLVAVSDRGSHTRFSYDVRGRTRRVARQIGKPDGFVATAGPYDSRWFAQRRDFDLGDRLRRKTTGADMPELQVGGLSQEMYSFTSGGRPFGIDSSYGTLIGGTSYLGNGAVQHVRYGDVATTTADFEYDSRQRLSRYHLSRTAAPLWTGAPTPQYSLPDSTTTQTDLADYRFDAYDDVGNPLSIGDASTSTWPRGASPVSRTFAYDDEYRVTQANHSYADPVWNSPYQAETAAGDRRPTPPRAMLNRVASQAFAYDDLGNVSSTDDSAANYDRSTGPATFRGPTDPNGIGPSQLQSASGIRAWHDDAGNLVALVVERAGSCPSGTANQCAQWFAYDWDEVGQLARARRWDFDGGSIPPQTPPLDPSVVPAPPQATPTWDLTYAYSMGQRVRKTSVEDTGVARHTLEVFDSLRIDHAPFDEPSESYDVERYNEHVYLGGGLGHVMYTADVVPHADSSLPNSSLYLVLGDHLGSNAVTIDHRSSEVVERTTFQAYGATESDYRPTRWASSREDYRFTGKEEDIEVGATYFGARYYQPYLMRFMSPDPVAIHGLRDLNPYAYVNGRVASHTDPTGLYDPQYTSGSGAPGDGYQFVDADEAQPEPEAAPEPQPSAPPTTVGGGSTLPVVDAPVPVAGSSKDPSRPERTTFERGVEAVLGLSSRHISLGGSAYFTVQDTRRAAINGTVSFAINAADPFGLRFVAKGVGVDLESKVMLPMTSDPNNKSGLVGGAAVVVASIAAGAAGQAAEVAAADAAAATPFRTVLAEGGAKIVEVTTSNGAKLQVAFEEIWDGTTLTLRGAHVQGAAPGQVGARELLRLAGQYGKSQGATKIVVEGARRTTSAMAGRIPRPWVINLE